MIKKISTHDFRQFSEQEIILGRYLTVLAGRNSTGKSTVLALLANSAEIKKNVCETYTRRRFRSEFNEIIKGSKTFDKTGSNRFEIEYDDVSGTQICVFRTTWQKLHSQEPNAERFRIIPKRTTPDGKGTEAKLELPVLYLGLSRLFPIGEAADSDIEQHQLRFDSDEHKKWFLENYGSILSLQDDISDVSNYSVGETNRKTGVGVTTEKYDYLTNSSGQDNLGQILLSILSFRRAKETMRDQWKGGLLLIDEIDATLHPIAQNRLIDLMCKEAKNLGIQIIITTHSLSLLKHICYKTQHNKEEPNQSIELYYFTTANRALGIKRNPDYVTIKNDLMIQSAIQNNTRIKIYTEDAEARWMLGHLLPEYSHYIKLLDTQIGYHELITLYKADSQYFGQCIIVFDGDVADREINIIPEVMRRQYNNIIKIPGNKRPEEVIYDYIMSLPSDHDFWDGADKVGLSWQYFRDNGPTSSQYSKEKERERYKKWFVDHYELFDTCNLAEYWLRDNEEEIRAFREQFNQIYNKMAERHMLTKINLN